MKTRSIKIFLLCFFLTQFLFQSYSQNNKSKQGNNFIHFFPDTALAKSVAAKLNKQISDNVTTKELANIKGDFEVGPNAGEALSNLKGIGYLTGIDTFHCYKNAVTEIPSEIGKLENLKYLDLGKAFELKKIPKEIGQLSHLKMVRLSLTQVTVIPNEIGNLSDLEILWIDNNNLTEIPKEIGNLKKLEDLDIHSNKIAIIPDEICNLTSLKRLNISHSGLRKLPDNIGNLKELQSLNLSNNNLTTLPKSISQLDNLLRLNIYDNLKLSESYKNYLPTQLKKKK